MTDAAAQIEQPTTPTAPRATWRAGLLALALVFAGPALQIAAIDVRWITRSNLFMWVFSVAAVVVALRALFQRPRILTASLSSVALLLGVGLLAMVNFGLTLPKTTTDKLTTAPEFALLDHTGRETTLAELRSGGGAVLIFYRGFW
ncbi:MAG: hypothetical protein ACKVS9_09205 [Phycisphaerae bacterium]